MPGGRLHFVTAATVPLSFGCVAFGKSGWVTTLPSLSRSTRAIDRRRAICWLYHTVLGYLTHYFGLVGHPISLKARIGWGIALIQTQRACWYASVLHVAVV